MKGYISAILIPCLLLQLYGCYSFNESTLEELLIKREGTITTKDKSIYFLKQRVNESDVLDNPDIYFSDDWIINQETEMITINTKKAYEIDNTELKENTDYGNWERNENWEVKKDTVTINFSEIKNVSVESMSFVKTSLLAILGLVIIFGIGLGSSGAFDFSLQSCERQQK
jgi:hypothetical protein